MREGHVLGGRYRVVSPLVNGGMGSLWRAKHLELGTPVAIKFMSERLLESRDAVIRFRREARAAASVRSAHVVQILDFGIDQGIPYIAMELLEGESLAQRLAQRGPLAPSHCVKVLEQVGRALELTHRRGIVHRDLKPSNVFLVREDLAEVVKLLDFGIAKSVRDSSTSTCLTQRGALVGTPHYMSPEQIASHDACDHRVDIWAMGVLGFECLLGATPFQATDLKTLAMRICAAPIPVPSQVGSVPEGFDAWFARSVERTIDRRYQTISEQVAALESIDVAGLRPDCPALAPNVLQASETLGAAACTAAAGETFLDSNVSSHTSLPPVSGSVGDLRGRVSVLFIVALAVVGIAIGYALRFKQERMPPARYAPLATTNNGAWRRALGADVPVGSVISVNSALPPTPVIAATSVTPTSNSRVIPRRIPQRESPEERLAF